MKKCNFFIAFLVVIGVPNSVFGQSPTNLPAAGEVNPFDVNFDKVRPIRGIATPYGVLSTRVVEPGEEPVIALTLDNRIVRYRSSFIISGQRPVENLSGYHLRLAGVYKVGIHVIAVVYSYTGGSACPVPTNLVVISRARMPMVHDFGCADGAKVRIKGASVRLIESDTGQTIKSFTIGSKTSEGLVPQ